MLGILGHNGMGKTHAAEDADGHHARRPAARWTSTARPDALRSSQRAQLGIGYVPQGRGIFPEPHRSRQSAHGRRRARGGRGRGHRAACCAISRAWSGCSTATAARCRAASSRLLALARCLVSQPDLILLDEPTEGIQPSIIDEIIDLLKALNTRTGIVDRAGGAEPRFHHGALRPRAADPEGPHRGRDRRLRGRRSGADRGIHRPWRQQRRQASHPCHHRSRSRRHTGCQVCPGQDQRACRRRSCRPSKYPLSRKDRPT